MKLVHVLANSNCDSTSHATDREAVQQLEAKVRSQRTSCGEKVSSRYSYSYTTTQANLCHVAMVTLWPTCSYTLCFYTTGSVPCGHVPIPHIITLQALYHAAIFPYPMLLHYRPCTMLPCSHTPCHYTTGPVPCGHVPVAEWQT